MSASPTKTMIYVVDDDLDVLGSLQFLLETDGFAVRTFKSGAALLNDAAPDNADCFVIDYKMPNMNGLDLVKRLRNKDISAPVILITGYPDEQISERVASAGVHHVLRKPLLDESLISHIRGALGDRDTRH
ncbi:response regulator [Bradyrhizobium sp.]|uniref:response regulator transcription factor n=1 Tax=Bradyrhizobium sp. TaxID=376 RepID=UPI001D5A9BD2|nr:response regulator [Bradyrhizobium sp.]MBI5320568.1 response regulator [Bradyrhizobium sp.]